MLGYTNNPGLLELVANKSSTHDLVIHDLKYKFDFLPSSTRIKPANSSDILNSPVVKQMLKSGLQHKLSSGTQLTNNLNLSYDAIDVAADGHITLNGHASGFSTPVFLESNIRGHLKGMSPSNAHAFLQSLPNVVDARVTQSPFGLPWLPLFSSRISLKIQEVSGSPSS